MPKLTLRLNTKEPSVPKATAAKSPRAHKTPKRARSQSRSRSLSHSHNNHSHTRSPVIRLKTSLKEESGSPKIIVKPPLPRRIPTIRVKPTMVPGDGYDSEDPEREDDPLMEEGIVLRMIADESLDVLRGCVESGDMTGIAVKWKDKRRAVLKVNGVMYGGKLVNLPTIVEVHKSVDKKNMYKTMDVCQMLLMVRKLKTEDEVYEIPVDKEYGETYPDGLTAPMRDCKRRFKRRYEEQVIQNVEDEVERLLKMDAEAESTNYEFIEGEGGSTLLGSGLHRKKHKKTSSAHKDVLKKVKEEDDDLDSELDKLIGEEEGSTTEEEDEDGGVTKARVEEDEGEAEEVIEGGATETEADQNSSESSGDDEDDEDEDDEDAVVEGGKQRMTEFDEKKQHSAILQEEISELSATIEQKQADLAKANNPIMKNRINDVISRLKQELGVKQKEAAEAVGVEGEKDAEKKEGGEEEKKEEEEEEEEDADESEASEDGDNEDSDMEGLF